MALGPVSLHITLRNFSSYGPEQTKTLSVNLAAKKLKGEQVSECIGLSST